MSNYDRFRDKLEALINQLSMENGSDTPDFILAEYLTGCLKLWDQSVHARRSWYDGHKILFREITDHTEYRQPSMAEEFEEMIDGANKIYEEILKEEEDGKEDSPERGGEGSPSSSGT